MNSPCCNNFFPPAFFKAILKTAELPCLHNVVSSTCQLLVAHFAMAVFVYLFTFSYKYKQRDMSFEFSSILSTVDHSKHLITA